jgi:hypothetical protein
MCLVSGVKPSATRVRTGCACWRETQNRMVFCGMLDLCRIIFGIVVDLVRPRVALEAEILVLRQQIIVLRRDRPSRVPFLAVDRMVLGWVCQLFPKTRAI